MELSSRTRREDADLVAVGIAEVGTVKRAGANAGRAFVCAAGRQRVLVDLLHDRARRRVESDHRAVAVSGGLAVERRGDADQRTVTIAVELAARRLQRKLATKTGQRPDKKHQQTVEVIGTKRDVTEHWFN